MFLILLAFDKGQQVYIRPSLLLLGTFFVVKGSQGSSNEGDAGAIAPAGVWVIREDEKPVP